jgi:predicted dehydrogenase
LVYNSYFATQIQVKKMQNITLGIIRCSNHSHEHFKAVNVAEGVSITSCCDIDLKRAKDCARLYKCNTYYKNLDDLLKNESFDGVIVCTWPTQHLEQIEKYLSAGVKNILCEKSLISKRCTLYLGNG